MPAAVLFDLDDTLIVDTAVAVRAFEATARPAAARHGLDADRLAADARDHARALWRGGPGYDWCQRIGMSSWEGLWARFEGEDPETRRLHAWARSYRTATWSGALGAQGISDEPLAEALGRDFETERRARHENVPGAEAVLSELGVRHPLGLVTNGDVSLQREKLDASGLGVHFDVVVVSGEVGVGKPDPAPFWRAVDALGLGDGDRAEVVMVGDNPVNDVGGALGAGLRAVWLDPQGDEGDAGRPSDRARRPAVEVPRVTSLAELPGVFAGL